MVGRSKSLRSVRYQLLVSHCRCSTDVSTWYANYVRPTENNCSNFGKRRVAGGIYESASLCLRNDRRDQSSISEHCGIYSLREVEYADLPTAMSSLLAHVVQYSAALL